MRVAMMIALLASGSAAEARPDLALGAEPADLEPAFLWADDGTKSHRLQKAILKQ